MNADEIKETDRIVTITRQAILNDLKLRAQAKDPQVRALDPSLSKRWVAPQEHYFSGGGTMPCPICQTGKLHYVRNPSNGHMHASCETKDCVRWSE